MFMFKMATDATKLCCKRLYWYGCYHSIQSNLKIQPVPGIAGFNKANSTSSTKIIYELTQVYPRDSLISWTIMTCFIVKVHIMAVSTKISSTAVDSSEVYIHISTSCTPLPTNSTQQNFVFYLA